MRVTIDYSVNMGYIKLEDKSLKGGKRNCKTIEVRDKVTDQTAFVIDVDKNGRLIGIEIFDAKRRMPKDMLKIAKDITSPALD